MKELLTFILTISLLASCSHTNTEGGLFTFINADKKQSQPAQPKVLVTPKAVEPIVAKPLITEVAQEYPTFTKPNSKKITNYCQKIDKYFKKYKWGKSHCEDYSWHHVRNSHWGSPIMWFTFGDEEASKVSHQNTTVIFCGVHGDEITPVKFCFDVLNDLRNNPQLFKDNVVVVAPIVTPDSFFRKYPTRTNARGVDVNRNFPTKDWNKSANKLWRTRYGSQKRRYPGKTARSEQETIFQINLINLYKADKIISVHSPLTLLDYDGPTHSHGKETMGHQLLVQMSQKAGKYRVNNYPFFTGSLGNWAGNERQIPTYTLELPNSDWTKTKRFFKTFRLAIHHAIEHDLAANKTSKKVTKTPVKNSKKANSDKVL